MDIAASWKSACEWVDGLSLRHRGLLFALILTLIYGALYGLLIRPLPRREQHIIHTLHAVDLRTQGVNKQLRHLVNPAAQARALAQFHALQTRLAVLRHRLSHLATGLVPPRDMTMFVRKALRRSPGVLVTRLQNLPAVAVAAQTKGAPVLYRHTLVLVIRGPYASLATYLERLARQRQRVLWGSFTLTADRYPYSTVNLKLYTLSLKRAFLR